MKKLILTLSAAAVLFSACQKETVNPVAKKQTVTYSVVCPHCSVYITDMHHNKGNEDVPSQTQHFLVDGTFDYSFENDTLSEARLEIYVGSFTPKIPVKATITTNDGRKAILSRDMGFGSNNDLIDTAIYLKLK